MVFLSRRIRLASKAALIHFLSSAIVACIGAALVFLVWYPYPYDLLSGGRKLFLILVCVDVVCGPLLTLVLFTPQKPRSELATDMALVLIIQASALIYGIHTAYEARPLFLAHEVDRFRVIAIGDYGEFDVTQSLAALPQSLKPHWLRGPVAVGMRAPRDEAERREVMLDAASGGRDYAQRPDFYIPYGTIAYQSKVLARAKPMRSFITHNPAATDLCHAVLARNGLSIDDAMFLPVMHKQEWVVMLDKSARILGFLPGEGFGVSD